MIGERYYAEYGRGANEYNIYVVSPEDQTLWDAGASPGAEEIDRAEAIRLGWTRPAEARTRGEHWPGGFATAPGGGPPPDPEGALDHCRYATAWMLRLPAAGGAPRR